MKAKTVELTEGQVNTVRTAINLYLKSIQRQINTNDNPLVRETYERVLQETEQVKILF